MSLTHSLQQQKVNLNLDLMQNAFLDKQLLNWQQNAPLQHNIM